MNTTLITNDQPLTTEEQRLLAEELCGVPSRQLLKVRATADSLVVVIHTGQKFIYDLEAIEAAVERLAAGAGRLAREVFLAELDAPLEDGGQADALALRATREAAPLTAPRQRQRPASRSKRP